jgi:hypothetical protein
MSYPWYAVSATCSRCGFGPRPRWFTEKDCFLYASLLSLGWGFGRRAMPLNHAFLTLLSMREYDTYVLHRYVGLPSVCRYAGGSLVTSAYPLDASTASERKCSLNLYIFHYTLLAVASQLSVPYDPYTVVPRPHIISPLLEWRRHSPAEGAGLLHPSQCKWR